MSSNGTRAGTQDPAQQLEKIEENAEKNLENDHETEPSMVIQSLDYWRQMTERQVERLATEIEALDRQKQPLLQQLTVLRTALRGLTPPPGRRAGGEHRGQRATSVTEEEREQIRRMVSQGASNDQIRAALPNVQSKSITNLAWTDRQTLRRANQR